MIAVYENSIREAIKSAFGIEVKDIYSNIVLPPNSKLGDIALPCFFLAKQLGENPASISQAIADKMKDESNLWDEVRADGPYLNLKLNRLNFVKEIVSFFSGDYKKQLAIGNDKRVIIDFSSPNIAKPFHIGHLRSTIIGNFLANLHTYLGYNVIRINHIGDWGTQFGALIVAWNKWGGGSDYSIKRLMDLYVRFHKEAERDNSLEAEARAAFAKLEQGDRDYTALWEKFRQVSLDEFERIYKRLDIDFDYVIGEAFYNSMADDTINKLKSKSIVSESEGALVVKLDDMPPCLLKKSDGTTLYALRDIAAIFYRKERFNYDYMYYVVGSPQTLHFKQVFAVVEKYNKDIVKGCKHIPFGHIKIKDGSMSTRKGNVILLEDVLDKAKELVYNIMKEKGSNVDDIDFVSDKIAIFAIIFSDLKNKRIKDIQFDWDRMLNFNGESGPYIEYTYARMCSLFRKHKEMFGDYNYTDKDITYISDGLFEIARQMFFYKQRLSSSIRELESYILADYMLELASAFNSYYNRERFLVEDTDIRRSNMALFSILKSVFKDLISMLGGFPIEKM